MTQMKLLRTYSSQDTRISSKNAGNTTRTHTAQTKSQQSENHETLSRDNRSGAE